MRSFRLFANGNNHRMPYDRWTRRSSGVRISDHYVATRHRSLRFQRKRLVVREGD
jgi:hypothetical protein